MYIKIGIVLCVFVLQALAEVCITPNKEKAECVALYSCPVLISALVTQQSVSIEFVRQSNCGGTGSNPMVCCGSSSNFTIPEKKNLTADQARNVTKVNLLPTRRYCGYQHSDDYFRTTNDTSVRINEFPWLARIISKRKDNTLTYICSGSLISNRYVLTAAHCLVPEFTNPVAVHLGDYNVTSKTDCVQEPSFEEECSEPIQTVGIERIIPHPHFFQGNNRNDIALLRLNRTVSYSDYVRPICLPLPNTTVAKIGDTLISSGWGLKSEVENVVEIKKKALNTLIINEECAKSYSDWIKINEDHLCTRSFSNNTDLECKGDSGAPLIFSHRNQWHQEGVLSFAKDCKVETLKVYMKVENYLDWILENIEK